MYTGLLYWAIFVRVLLLTTAYGALMMSAVWKLPIKWRYVGKLIRTTIASVSALHSLLVNSPSHIIEAFRRCRGSVKTNS